MLGQLRLQIDSWQVLQVGDSQLEGPVFLQGNPTTIVKVGITTSKLFLKFFQEFWLIIRVGKVAAGLSQTGQVLLQEGQFSLVDAAGRQELKTRLLSVENC